MRNKIAAGIMLLAGSVAVVVCLIKNASLDTMLVSVFLSMFIFMIIGFAVQAVIEKMDKDAAERMKEEAEKKRQLEAEIQAQKEEEERLAREEEIKRQMADKDAEQSLIDDVLAAGISAKYNASNK